MSVIKSKTTHWPVAPDYYEGRPDGFDIYSWSPSPPGTPLETASPSTQVHLHGITSIGRVVWRFKGPATLDGLIAALIKHREDVFGSAPVEAPERERIRNEALEEAAQFHESVNPASDAERLAGAPGAGAMGAVIEYRDGIRGLKR